ncbi:unnamed protein product [Closterium sp. Naga37s-1]|nr:unnamed protein product [Closterium sp. Naga37s-1]
MGNSCSAPSAVWATDDNLGIDASRTRYSHHRVTRFAQLHAKTADRRAKKADSEAPNTGEGVHGSDGSGAADVAGKDRNVKSRSHSKPRKIEQKLFMRGAYAKMADAGKATETDGSLEAKYHVGKLLGSGKHGSVRVCWPREKFFKEQPGQSVSFSSPLPCSSESPLSFASSPSSPFGFESLSSGLSSGVSSPSPASSPAQSQGGHPGVVRLYDVVDDAQHTHIVMQLCEGPSLKDRIAQQGAMSEREAARVMRSVVSVLAYCHDRGIVHRDVKDCNFIFLFNDPASPLVAIDFGLATFYSQDKRLHEVAGSPCFVAPEVLRVRGGGGYGPEVDVWSAGVLLHLLLAGRVPFDGVTIMDVFRAVASAPLDLESPPLQSLSPEAKDLLTLMLCRDVSKRPSAHDILRHPWLAQDSDVPSH